MRLLSVALGLICRHSSLLHEREKYIQVYLIVLAVVDDIVHNGFDSC